MSYYYNPRGGSGSYAPRSAAMQNYGTQSNFQNPGYGGRTQYSYPRGARGAGGGGYSNRISGIRPSMTGIRPLFPNRNTGFQTEPQREEINLQSQIAEVNEPPKPANFQETITKQDNSEPYDPLTATLGYDSDEGESKPKSMDERLMLMSSSSQSANLKKQEPVPPAVKLAESEQAFYPSEIKNVPVKEIPKFTCELCLVTCSSELNLQAHLEGARHMKNLKKQDNVVGQARANNVLNDIEEPIIGLNFVVEYQSMQNPTEQRYLCKLCNVKGNTRVLIAHLTGYKHRMEYIKKHHMEDYTKLQQVNGPTTVAVAKLAMQIEQREGRGDITVAIDETQFLPLKRSIIDSPSSFKRIKRNDLDDTSENISSQSRTQGSETIHESAKQQQLVSSSRNGNATSKVEAARENVTDSLKANVQDTEKLLSSPETWNLSGGMLGEIMQHLSKCIIKNEDDARVALHVSTCLTNALLKYRLENMPVEILKATLSSETAKALLKEQADSNFKA